MIYAIFLRGINTGKLKLLSEDFKALLINAGCEQVKTIQAAGTAVFSSSEPNPCSIQAAIEKELSGYFGKRISSVLRSKEQIELIVSEVAPIQKGSEYHDYIMLTDDPTVFFEAEKLHTVISYLPGERLLERTDYFIWTIPKGRSLDEFGSKVLGSKSLKERLTSRNFNTIVKVAEAMTKL